MPPTIDADPKPLNVDGDESFSARSEVQYQTVRHDANRYTTPTWRIQKLEEPETNVWLWAGMTLGVIVATWLITPLVYSSDDFGAFLVRLFFCAPLGGCLEGFRMGDVWGYFASFVCGCWLLITAGTVGWVLHAIVLLTGNAYRKRRAAIRR
jgi:hypothetical protein